MSRSHNVYLEEGFDFRFQFPFSTVISGPSSSGNTVFVKNVLCDADKFYIAAANICMMNSHHCLILNLLKVSQNL